MVCNSAYVYQSVNSRKWVAIFRLMLCFRGHGSSRLAYLFIYSLVLVIIRNNQPNEYSTTSVKADPLCCCG